MKLKIVKLICCLCLFIGVPEDASVKMARNRFKNVLRHMSLQDSYMHDDESDSDTEEGKN